MICSLARVKGLLSYGWKLLISSLLDTGYNQLRSLIIGKIYTSEDLAYYNHGERYPSLIVVNINNSISSVLFPALAKNQNETDRIKEMTRKAIQVSSYIMWPLMVGLGIIAEPMVKMILTDKWIDCVPFIRVFCFSYGLWPIHTANLQAINAMGRSDLYLKLEIIKKLSGLMILFISVPFGPLVIAWGLAVMGILSTFINAMPNVKLLGYSYKEQLRDSLLPFILSLVMALVIYPFNLFGLKNLVVVVLQILSGGILYILLSIITKQSAFYYLLSFFKDKNNIGIKYHGK